VHPPTEAQGKFLSKIITFVVKVNIQGVGMILYKKKYIISGTLMPVIPWLSHMWGGFFCM